MDRSEQLRGSKLATKLKEIFHTLISRKWLQSRKIEQNLNKMMFSFFKKILISPIKLFSFR